MRVTGEWFLCQDGVVRPTLEAYVVGADGELYADRFLVDSGADRSTFSADFASRLNLAATSRAQAVGIGGREDIAFVATVLVLKTDEGQHIRVRGEFAVFTNPEATDLSILGRDVLNNFHVILSKPRQEILILTPQHPYNVSS